MLSQHGKVLKTDECMLGNTLYNDKLNFFGDRKGDAGLMHGSANRFTLGCITPP